MAIPTTLESLSTTAASNGPSGSDDRSTADDGLRYAYAFIKQTVSLGSNIASATTITPPSTGAVFNVTGTTTIAAIASTNSWDGRVVTLIFAGALQLTHSSNLALPGSANITTAANDVATFVQTASGAWRLLYYAVAADSKTFQGSLTVNGNTTLGNAGGDTTTFNGNVTYNAPTAGTTALFNNVSGARNISLVGASGSAAYLGMTDGKAGNREYLITVGENAAGTFSIRDSTGGTDRFLISSAGLFGYGGNVSTDAHTFYGNLGFNNGATLTQINNRGSNDLELVTRNAASNLKFYSGNATLAMTLDTAGNTIAKLNGTAPTLTTNSTMSFELTSNTSLKIVVRGSDGTTRSTTLTLA